ncbi:hypothetical protein CBR_g1179 [Chara braunii]|uniref:Uncharacterized protein n=1 Tax=Chara braunii TaxID=69332 RepID=A0A388KDB6_CHABU|nr:hypothetical protein CBR_g1179 [Chara braunii]|eukprot:GBG68058.1 hypothetical protein CBR_g1179 [Chara braunii]
MAAAPEEEEVHGHTGRLLDFRSAFHGSVFEKYHVLPLQLATLDAGAVVWTPPYIKISQFLMHPGNVDLLKRDREAFVNEFVKFCDAEDDTTRELPLIGKLEPIIADCHDAADVASKFMTEFGLFRKGEESEDAVRDRFRKLGTCQDSYTDLEVGQYLGLCIKEFALSRSMRVLARAFRRAGVDVTHECDETLARKLYDVGKTGAPDFDYLPIGDFNIFDTIVHLIDFDLVGRDGEHFSLRIILTTYPSNRDDWSAEVRDRQKGTLIAICEGEMSDNVLDECYNADGGPRTLVNILDGNVVQERYKPHGDVPTRLTTVTTSADSSSSRFCKLRDGWVLDEDEAVRLYCKDCCLRGIISTYDIRNELMKSLHRLPQASFVNENGDSSISDCSKSEFELFLSALAKSIVPTSNIGPEEMKSLYHLREASFVKENGDSISYCGESEFERLLPVAASLAYLYDGWVSRRVYSSFDSVVQHFRLHTSSLQESQQRDFQEIQKNCKRFHRIFKGTWWDRLPEDLIVRIIEMAVHPRRNIVLPWKSY